MFDSGFSELMLIMVVALVVVGPERLPGLARKVGYWVGRFRRYASMVRAEIEREINADELRSMLTRQEDEIRELRDMLQDTREQMRVEIDDASTSGSRSSESSGGQEAPSGGKIEGSAQMPDIPESASASEDAPPDGSKDGEHRPEMAEPVSQKPDLTKAPPTDITSHDR